MIPVSERETHWKVKEIEAVIDFVKECCYLGANAEVKTKDLYEHYVAFCENTSNEIYIVGKNKLVTILNSTLNMDGCIVRTYRTNTHRGLRGIGIK